MSIEPSYQSYEKTIKNFYLRVIKKHPNMLKLSRHLLQMIQNIGKKDSVLIYENLTGKKQDLSVEKASNASYSKSVKSLRSLSNIKSSAVNYIFQSQYFKKIVLFAYLYYVITVSNTDIFNIIQTKSKLLIDAVQQQKIIDHIKWQRCAKQWKKIMQLLSHKAKVRWEKILSNSITSLEDDFTDVVLRSIMSNSTNLTTLFSNVSQNIEQFSTLLKISICYFEMNKGEIIQKIECGTNYKFQLKIAYFQNTKSYAVYQKLPNSPHERRQQMSNIIQHTKLEDKNYLSINQPIQKNEINKSIGTGLQCSQTSHKSKKQEEKKSQEKSDKSVSDTSKKRTGLPCNLIKKKSLRVIQALLRQYNNNMNKLNDLQCMAAQESKDAKIKKMLENRTKNQDQ